MFWNRQPNDHTQSPNGHTESFVLYEQETKKNYFAFTYNGPQLASTMFEGLSVINIEGTKDPHDLYYVTIKTAERKRANQIQDAIEHWNSECQSSKIILQPLVSYPPICTFGKSSDASYSNHHIVKRILEDKAKKADGSPSNYFSSNDTEIEEDFVPAEAPVEPATTSGKRAAYKSSAAGAAKYSEEEVVAIVAAKVAAERDKMYSEMMKTIAKKMDRIEQQGEASMQKLDGSMQKLDVVVATVQERKTTDQVLETLKAENKDLAFKNASDAAKRGHITRKANIAAKKDKKTIQDLTLKVRSHVSQRQLAREVVKVVEAESRRRKRSTSSSSDGSCLSEDEEDQFDETLLLFPAYKWFPKFKRCLQKLLNTKQNDTSRRPALPISATSVKTQLRYMAYCMKWGLYDIKNIKEVDESVHRHRLYLQMYAGPIYRQDIFKEIQDVYLQHIKALCKALKVKNTAMKLEYAPILDPFNIPEVMQLYFAD